MRNPKVLLLSGLLCWLTSTSFGQLIKGEVHDKTNHAPLGGASISLPNSRKGTTTDLTGAFSLQSNGAKSFTVSAIGYKPQTIAVTDAAIYQVELETSDKALDQVVVVGYGTQKKANLTGSVATVDVTKTFGSKPLNDPTKALQGVVPGLTIQYGSGSLTAAADIKIRGIGSINGASRPLIIVDNVQTDDLSIINPNDIESVSVLKDAASASIYGARAAFGVVLIKTKTGRKNQKPVVTYSDYFSGNTPTILADFADPVAELAGLNQAGVRSGTPNPNTFGMDMLTLRQGIINWKNTYAKTNTGQEMIKGQDWDQVGGTVYFYKVWDPKKEMLNNYTFSQQHNLSVSGGSDKINYYISGGYSYDGGIFKLNPDDVKKYNITASVNANVTPWLDLNVKTMFRNFQYDYPYQYQDYWYYFWRWGSYFPYGTYQGKYFRTNSAYLSQASKSNLSSNYSRVDLGATVKILKNLNFRADYTIGRDNLLRHEGGGPVMAWDFWTPGPVQLANIASTSADFVQYTTGRNLVDAFNGYFTYTPNIFEDHHFKFTAGVNAEKDENVNFYANKLSLLDPSHPELSLATGTMTDGATTSGVPTGGSNAGHGERAFAGYFGRINYDYKEKFLLELNGRYDGSNLFPQQDRWTFFSSASAGYRISEENFMQRLKPVLSDLKVRGSYGELGNQDVNTTGVNMYLASMTGVPSAWVTSSGTQAQSILQPSSIANSLKWERISTLDFGVDGRLFDNHIGFSFDWYQRENKGMIQPTTVPSTFGIGGPFINAGNMRTRGYEISIDANYRIGKDLQVYGSVGLSDYTAIFTKWYNPNMAIDRLQNYQGKTYGEIWGFQTDGYIKDAADSMSINQSALISGGSFKYGPGDIKYKDLNHDGKIDGGKATLSDHGDLKKIGNNQPRYTYNFRLGASWKGFDIDAFFQGVAKRDWWGSGQTVYPLWQSIDVLYKNQLDYWTPDHTNARYPKLYPGNTGGTIAGLYPGNNNFYPQTKYLLNMAYLRLKNLTVGYAVTSRVLEQHGITKLRFYFSGQNIWTKSNVGAPIDPELTDASASGAATGRVYPFDKSYSFGMQLAF